MKKNVLAASLFAALLLTNTVVLAEGSDASASTEQYPAMDYQPEVVYSDAGTSSDAKAETKSEDKAEAKSEDKVEAKKEDNSMLLGLVVLAVAGGFFVSQKKKCPAKAESVSATAETVSAPSTGATGVEKYLQAREANSATGVAKYLAQKEASDKEASLTGVDKYLRNRG